MTTEPALKVCTYCENEKVRIWSGAKLKDGSRVFIDQKHQRWAGRRCPDCEKSRVQTAVKCDRFAKANILRELESKGFEIVSSAVPIKVRKDGIRRRVLHAHALWPRPSVRRELSELSSPSGALWPRPSATAYYTLGV